MGNAIEIDHLSKEYRLGVVSYGMLYKDLQSMISRWLGRDDPNAVIDEHARVHDTDKFWALNDVSLSVQQGDRVGIIGRNGAGKSTLLKILSRITAPTKGIIRVKGRIASLLEVGTGFHPELTGRENVFLNGTILGMKTREIDRKMEEIVSFAEIGDFLDTPVKRYSSGMYVRLGFAIAAHLDSEILLADEVLAVGDISFQKKCLAKMSDISLREGRTVVYVSHNMSTLQGLCNTGILLDNGQVAFTGTIEDSIDRYIALNTAHLKERKFESTCGRFSLAVPRWINEQGETVDNYEYGEKIILRFEFDFARPVPRINPGFAVLDRLGQRVFTSHMADDSSYQRGNEYSGHVVIDTDLNLPTLAPGHYTVNFGVRDEKNDTVLLADDCVSLDIKHSLSQKDGAGGVLWHTSRWMGQEPRKNHEPRKVGK